MQIKNIIISSLLVTALISLTGCSVNPVSGKKEFTLVSEDQELAMGAQGHKSVLKKYKRYNDPALQAYVNGLGQTLASKSHRNNIKYTFTVLEDPSVNAFALPGGYIYVTTGILAYLNSEGELAGVLGHEIGHVTARHGARQQSMGVVGAILGEIIASKTKTDRKSINQLSHAILSGYGREHELEADKLGAEYLARVGYSPQNMLDVIGVLKAQEQYGKYLARKSGQQVPPSYHGVFATHPDNDRRLQNVVAAANHIHTAASKPANHDGYLQRINGLKYRIDKKHTGRIVIGRATTPGLTYAQLARRSKVGEQRLRLINGMFPKGEPVQGRLVKIIQ